MLPRMSYIGVFTIDIILFPKEIQNLTGAQSNDNYSFLNDFFLKKPSEILRGW